MASTSSGGTFFAGPSIFSAVVGGLGLFVLLSAPSLKLVHSTPIINAVPALAFILCIALNRSLFNLRLAREILIAWAVFSAVLFVSGLQSPGGLSVVTKYIYLVGIVPLAVFSVNRAALRFCIGLLLGWGLFLSLWEIILGVPTDRSLGQHYLTVAMPIGAAFAATAVYAAFPTMSLRRRLAAVVVAAILAAGMASLGGRAAMLFSVLSAMAITIAASIWMDRSLRAKIFSLVMVIGSALVAVAILVATLRPNQLRRLAGIFNDVEGEARFEIYQSAISAISHRPIFGYGFGSSASLFGSYPHNLFLELMTHGGVILLLAFIPILFLAIKSFRRELKNQKSTAVDLAYVGFAATSLFLFLQWNVSFNLAGAFLPLSCVVLLAALRDEAGRRTFLKESR